MVSKLLLAWSLLLVVVLSCSAALAQEDELVEGMPEQRRQLWDFFSFVSLMMAVGPASCEHPDGSPNWGPKGGPKWKHCSGRNSSNSNGGSTYDSSSTSTTTSSYSYMENVSSESATKDRATDGSTFGANVEGFQLWMVVVAGSVATALVAVHLGQRKEAAAQRHGMSGAVMRRVGAVGAFAAGAFPNRRKASVEMSSSQPDYRLDTSPDGNSSVPSAVV